MKNVIIYVRVSTDEQARTGYSLGHQEAVLTKFCELKGWNVIATYKEDFSAKTFDRPEYKSLYKFCKANKRSVDYVLVSKWDRFSRNVNYALTEIENLERLGIEVNAAEQWIDFSIPQNKILLTIYLTLPEIDNDVRSINVITGLRNSWKSGRWTGTAPVGYRNDRDDIDKPILIKSHLAPLVVEAFELYATGVYEKQELRKIMAKKGLKLSKSQFPNMLSNYVYCGKVFVPQYKGEAAEVVQGIHEGIISEALFEKVQAILKGKYRSEKRQYENLDDNAPLRGLLICSCCGGRLTSSSSKGRSKYYTYYHCRNGCKERLSTNSVHEAFLDRLDQMPVKPAIAALFLEVKGNFYKATETEHKASIEKISADIEAAEEKLISLNDSFISQKIDQESYNLMKVRYNDNLKKLRILRDEQKDQEVNVIRYIRSSVNIIQNAPGYYNQIKQVSLKQKFVGSIFPENLKIENGQCRTVQECRLELALKGFDRDFKGNGSRNRPPFPSGSPNGNRTRVTRMKIWCPNP